jgi:polar amino acid transport system substrate-binding protein
MITAPRDVPLSQMRAALAPTGRLRTGMNYSNTILTQRDRGDGQPGGVASELARELGRRLDVPVDFIAFDSPGEVVDAIAAGRVDICFLAIEPSRAEHIDFTAPYVLIESTYLVREDSPLRTTDQADRPDMRIGVMGRAAYDLYLTRTLKAAQIVRGDPGYLDDFMAGKTDAAAGIRQMLADYARGRTGLRILPGAFAVVQQAMGVAKGNPAGPWLAAYVEEMKASGFVARALRDSGQDPGAAATPA